MPGDHRRRIWRTCTKRSRAARRSSSSRCSTPPPDHGRRPRPPPRLPRQLAELGRVGRGDDLTARERHHGTHRTCTPPAARSAQPRTAATSSIRRSSIPRRSLPRCSRPGGCPTARTTAWCAAGHCGLVRSDPVLDAEALAGLYRASSFDYGEELEGIRATYGAALDRLAAAVARTQRPARHRMRQRVRARAGARPGLANGPGSGAKRRRHRQGRPRGAVGDRRRTSCARGCSRPSRSTR